MMRIGLIAEDSNDSSSFKNLMERYYKKCIFSPILERYYENQLDAPKFKRLLQKEYSQGKYKNIIVMRDLDGLRSETGKYNKRLAWFNSLNSVVNKKGIFLLNIYELEALILADIKNFNKCFNAKLKFNGNPMMHKEPKEHLMRQTKKHQRSYSENNCPEIFSMLDINVMIDNCAYFKDFIVTFERETKLKKAA